MRNQRLGFSYLYNEMKMLRVDSVSIYELVIFNCGMSCRHLPVVIAISNFA